MKVGRNQPCPCGNGRKFKHCHGLLGRPSAPPPPEMLRMLEVHRAQERIRQTQQGLGRDIVSAKLHDHQMVAVGNTIHWSKNWKTFPDFLADYLKKKLTAEWGNAEIAKPLAERHVIMQWYDDLCRYQSKGGAKPGEVKSSEVTGIIACYYGLAYGLYMLEHNVELQERMLRRLKDPANFQGAYYELMVASALIRAGFELTLEDETDPNTKHCEFAATSKASGKKYWIEAKMRGVVGLLGRTSADGTTSTNPISHMVRHLNNALGKPAPGERMIFIDVNTKMPFDVSDENRPTFVDLATRRLEQYEQNELRAGGAAYVFITNLNFHRNLEDRAQLAAFPFGLGMPDFDRKGMYRMSERYRQEKRHADALNVLERGFSKLLVFPVTFDGSLPSVTLAGEKSPVLIGQSYNFEGAGPDGTDLKGTVADATVMEAEKTVVVAVNCEDGTSRLLKEKMTDGQFADYRANRDAYFGKVVRPPIGIKTPHELFEFFMYGHRGIAREELLKRLGSVAGIGDLPDDELLALYCEGLVLMSGMFKVVDGVIQA